MSFRAGVAPNPPGLGDFLLVMADAYLCAMPMTYDMISRVNISDSVNVNRAGYSFEAVTIDATSYTYFRLDVPSISITSRNTDSRSISGRYYWYIAVGGTRISDEEYSEELSIRVNETATVTLPTISYEGPLTATDVSIYIRGDFEDSNSAYADMNTSCVITYTGYLRY